MEDWKYLEKNTEDGKHLLYRAMENERGGRTFSAILFKDDYIRAVVYFIDQDHPIKDGDTEGSANKMFDNLRSAREWCEESEKILLA